MRSSVAAIREHLDFEVGYNEERARSRSTSSMVVVEEVDLPGLRNHPEKRPARSIPNVQLDDESGFKLKIEDLAASRPSAKQSDHPAHRTPSRKSYYENTGQKGRRSSAASSSVGTAAAGSSTSAAPRPFCPRRTDPPRTVQTRRPASSLHHRGPAPGRGHNHRLATHPRRLQSALFLPRSRGWPTARCAPGRGQGSGSRAKVASCPRTAMWTRWAPEWASWIAHPEHRARTARGNASTSWSGVRRSPVRQKRPVPRPRSRRSSWTWTKRP